jgi:hypothetical protein
MHNPLALLTTPLMEAMLKEPKLFVREHYPRGFDHFDVQGTIPLLFTYYEKTKDVEYNRAHFHFRQLKEDAYAFIYDSENPLHRERLLKAASQPSPYKCYTNLLLAEWKAPAYLRTKMHNYMLHHLSWWNYNKTNSLHVHLKDRYGKLFLQMSWKGNHAEVLLDDIENFSPCATT